MEDEMNYASFTEEEKAKIRKAFHDNVNAIPRGATLDGGHIAAAVSCDVFGLNYKRATKKDGNNWASVLAFLIFDGLLKCNLPQEKTS